MSIVMYSCLTSYFYMVIPGKYAINYYICAGLDPNVDPYDQEKVIIFILFEVLFSISINKAVYFSFIK